MVPLNELVAKILELPTEEITDETGTATTGAWTSLRHVHLVVALERSYDVRLSPRDARSARSVADLRRLLAAHGLQP